MEILSHPISRPGREKVSRLECPLLRSWQVLAKVYTEDDLGQPSVSDLHNLDWLNEIQRDAQHVYTLLLSLDQQLNMANANLRAKNITDAMIRLSSVREGLRLIAEVMGLKLA